MANLAHVIETFEHRWMRAWVNRDARVLKALTARDFILLTGSKPPMLLDRRSWLDAAADRWDCASYRFGDIYVRSLGPAAIFAAPLELRAAIEGRDWSGTVWVTDIWRRTMTRRAWKMTQRIVSRIDGDRDLAKAVKSLQLWK